jgi:hypothetical protein
MGEIATGETIYAAHHVGWGARNLVRNGGFDTLYWTNWFGSLPEWQDVLTPQLATSADVAADAGAVRGDSTPYSLRITAAGAANEGIEQTLGNLKVSTTYTFWCRVKVTAGDTISVVTTGATTNLALSSTSDTWATLEGQFVTDGSGTDVVLQILAAADGDIVYVDDVMVVEGAAGRRPWMPSPFDHVLQTRFYKDFGDQLDSPSIRMEFGAETEDGNPLAVTFKEEFEDEPYIVATVLQSATPGFIVIEVLSTTGFSAQAYDAAGNDDDLAFCWVAIGPRFIE